MSGEMMSVILLHPNDRGDLQEDYKTVSAWTQESDQMPDHHLEALMAYPMSVLAYDNNANVLGHVALTSIDGTGFNKRGFIGALVVKPDCRQQHVGETLVQHLIQIVGLVRPDVSALAAYANETSLQLFTKLGGQAFKRERRPGPCQYHVSVPLGVRPSTS